MVIAAIVMMMRVLALEVALLLVPRSGGWSRRDLHGGIHKTHVLVRHGHLFVGVFANVGDIVGAIVQQCRNAWKRKKMRFNLKENKVEIIAFSDSLLSPQETREQLLNKKKKKNHRLSLDFNGNSTHLPQDFLHAQLKGGNNNSLPI